MSRRLQYSEDSMRNAVAAVKSGIPAFRAHKLFNVPRSTLVEKVQGKYPIERTIGHAPVLEKNEENLLVQWILNLANSGFPVTKLQLLDSVELLIKNLKRPNTFTNGRPGRRWYELFMKRHPELSARISQNLTNARASVTEKKIRGWFKEISEYLDANGLKNLLNEPERIFNCDETALYMNPKDDRVIVRKGEKAVYTFNNNDEKECLTTLITCSARGQVAPPMIMFNYKRIPKTIAENVPETWGIGRSENGWMTGESFYEYIANIFHPWLIHNNIQFPIILFLDGHTSHLTMTLSKFCSEHQIEVISLLPNSTHILQPLDVAAFRPLKMEYRKAIRQWRIQNNGNKLKKEDFAPVLKMTIDSMKNIQEITRNGFKACGLVPMNPDNINYSKYFKDQPLTNVHIKEAHQTHEDKRTLNQYFTFLEKEITDKLVSFNAAGDEWNGPIEDESLFKLWHSLKRRIHVTAENSHPLDDEEDITETLDTTNLNLDQPIVIDIQPNYNDSLVFTSSAKLIKLGNILYPTDNTVSEIKKVVAENVVLGDSVSDNATVINDLIILCDNDIISSPITEIPLNFDKTDDKIWKRNKENSPLNETGEVYSQYTGLVESPIKVSNAEAIGNEDNIQDENVTFHKNESNIIHSCRASNDALNSKENEENHIAKNRTKTLEEKLTCTRKGEEIEQCSNKEPNIFETSHKTPEKNPKIEIENQSVKTSFTSNNLPTPFKKSLFWPEQKPQTTKRPRDKVPAVATSKEWQQYHHQKEEKKIKELREKEKRISERKRKQEERKENLGKRRKFVEHINQETNNLMVEDKLKANDYVIVNYNEQLFPGQIIGMSIDTKNIVKYKVNHMERNGLNWKWPTSKDILSYEKGSIVQKIHEPIIKNNRGLYVVKELSSFLP